MKLLQADSDLSLAQCAAKMTVEMLSSAIESNGEAVWVMGGGKTPALTYEVIATRYADFLDWRKVWFFVSDERHVKFSNPDSNWGLIENRLLSKLDLNAYRKLSPDYYDDLNKMTDHYESLLDKLPKSENGLPRFDVIWLGIGEDGHTLSLFPGSNLHTPDLAISVVNSPKPPAERLTLTLSSLAQNSCCLILVTGETKAEAVKGLVSGDKSLPITLAAEAIENANGSVCLMCEKQATSLISN